MKYDQMDEDPRRKVLLDSSSERLSVVFLQGTHITRKMSSPSWSTSLCGVCYPLTVPHRVFTIEFIRSRDPILNALGLLD
jgi:hypothetical protein